MFSPSNSSESYLGLPYNLRWSSLLQALTVVTKRLILDFEKTELPTNQPTNQPTNYYQEHRFCRTWLMPVQ